VSLRPKILHLAYALDDMIERFARIGDQQQIVQVHAMHAGPVQPRALSGAKDS